MSTRTRKARKAQPIAADRKLVKVPKVGTPVELRVENQSRMIMRAGTFIERRFGLPPKAARRLRDRGVEAPTPEVES